MRAALLAVLIVSTTMQHIRNACAELRGAVEDELSGTAAARC